MAKKAKAESTPAAESLPLTTPAPAEPAAESQPSTAKARTSRKFTKLPTQEELQAHEEAAKADFDRVYAGIASDNGEAELAEQTPETTETPEVTTPETVAETTPTAATPAKTSALASIALKLGLPEAAIKGMTDEQLGPLVDAMYERNLNDVRRALEKPPEQQQQQQEQEYLDPELTLDPAWVEENAVPEHLVRPLSKMAERTVKLEKRVEELTKALNQDQNRRNADTVHGAFNQLEAPLKKLFGQQIPQPGSPELERRMMVLHSLKQRPIPGNLPLHQQIAIRAGELLPIGGVSPPPPLPNPELEQRRQQWSGGTVANPRQTAVTGNDPVEQARAQFDQVYRQAFGNRE